MHKLPLLTQNMDMTLEFFFSQKSSLYVMADEHYEQFKTQVFQYAPLLTTMNYESIEHMQTWDILRDLYFMLACPKDSYFEEPLTNMIFSVRHLLLKNVRETVSFETIDEAIQHQPNRAYIAALAITRVLMTWFKDVFQGTDLAKQINENTAIGQIDIRPLFEEKYSTIEPVPSEITALQGKIVRQMIKYTNEHPTSLEDYLKEAHRIARTQWSMFEKHHV
ncbi:hypothetical protein [Kurthia massiliensis]|uniref:hypothetical protein n=1 Tax=Kurthia massiliensis TaxID=1033739 RepID=UPI000289B9C1|nr:hypothetical protein [Kurthia massiliensis]